MCWGFGVTSNSFLVCSGRSRSICVFVILSRKHPVGHGPRMRTHLGSPGPAWPTCFNHLPCQPVRISGCIFGRFLSTRHAGGPNKCQSQMARAQCPDRLGPVFGPSELQTRPKQAQIRPPKSGLRTRRDYCGSSGTRFFVLATTAAPPVGLT